MKAKKFFKHVGRGITKGFAAIGTPVENMPKVVNLFKPKTYKK